MVKAYLEFGDIELLEEAASCLRDRLLIRLLARLGCRISEALALRVGDIDFVDLWSDDAGTTWFGAYNTDWS